MNSNPTNDSIRIDLDHVRVYRNTSEYRSKQRARSSLGHEITGDGPLVSKLAAVLREENPEFDGLLEVYRGSTLCFIPTPLKSAFRKGLPPKHLRKVNS
ncbi:hypothetical protein PSA7680_00295 [Pseudoruegeria aquimaris]|uniref:Uncharacterized protein n=1 Tax=Pseudoruegeria aquimaris TaxID=393663 RepID=A0A1Y5RGI6_9RHOB|nr:hypothetical protein [Pseudoruegeria aquimaris]SLN14143.1 hypothetical protein PSA7680_00295 [Pseudoruegeria aquimaris]